MFCSCNVYYNATPYYRTHSYCKPYCRVTVLPTVLPWYQPCVRVTVLPIAILRHRVTVLPYYRTHSYVTVLPCYRVSERIPTLLCFRVTVLPTVLFCNIRAPQPPPPEQIVMVRKTSYLRPIPTTGAQIITTPTWLFRKHFVLRYQNASDYLPFWRVALTRLRCTLCDDWRSDKVPRTPKKIGHHPAFCYIIYWRVPMLLGGAWPPRVTRVTEKGQS